MANAGASIEAILTLDSSGFQTGVTKSLEALDKFKTTSNKVNALNDALKQLQSSLGQLDGVSKSNLNTFSRLSTAVNKMANGLKILNSDSVNVEQAVNTMNSIFQAFQGTLSSVTFKLENVATVERQVASATRTSMEAQQQAIASLNANRNAVMGLITGKNQDTSATQRNTEVTVQNSNAKQRDVASTNQLSSATSRLGKAMSSLRMIGTMVGSMLAYNFAHKLLVATGETIHAKSEMEGYFKMLHFGQSDIDDFNNALNDTVKQFQRVNKYSLGETISSIGVEFNLTTEEMKKAMKVTSMITSEYLRAGRNANEASLAVKDVLQGQFQRLSRETGVKGEQLKEAGWSGDTTDVLGLMEALEKVGESRNWDVFAEKANSLNDILTITQNRFGEWSADMVNVVQPTIVNVFNAIMSAFDNITPVLSGFWEWLNTDGWGQSAVKIGALVTTILTLSQAMLMYRAEVGLVEASQMGLGKSIASLVLGLKGQEIAEVGVRNAILSKILGVQAETIAEKGVYGAIVEKIASLQASTVQEEANTLATTMNTTAQKLATDTTNGLGVAKEVETAQEEVNTAMKELNTLETLKQEEANGGLIASLYLLGTAEIYDAEATGTLATMWGVLNGIFELSPIGFITTAILGLAGAIYVLTGGLDEGWEKMQIFNQTVERGTEALKPYQDRVNKLQTQLDYAREKYGENSEQVQKLKERYDRADESLKKFNESLQYGVKITDELSDEQDQLVANMDAITRKNYGSLGHSSEEVDQIVKQMNAMGYGYDKSYIALQKLVRMQENFDNEQQKAIPLLNEHGRGVDENVQNLGRWNEKYQEYIKQSTNANLADNWWDWAWASMYAGMSKNDANAILVTEAIETKLRDAWTTLTTGGLPPFFKGDIDKQIADYINGLGDSFNQWVANCDWGETINGAWESFSQSIQNFDLLGSIQTLLSPITTSLDLAIQNLLAGLSGNFFTYIMNIPIVSDFLQLFGLLNGENTGSSQKGNELGNSFKTSIEHIILSIPILSDVYRIITSIQQAVPTASSMGNALGSAIKSAFQNAISGMANLISTEVNNIINFIRNSIDKARDVASQFGDAIKGAVKGALQINSPGIIAREIVGREFSEYIPNSILDASSNAYDSAYNYAQQIKQGIQDNGTTTIGMDGMVQDYQSDAQIISDSSQMMGTTTTTAFNDMALSVNDTTGLMQSNVVGTYSAIASSQSSSLNSMKQQNVTAYNDMYLKSNQSLIQMRDSTSNITHQMTNAWNSMKNSIVASAHQLQSDSTVHFNTLSNTIGGFYRKIQNPSSWGSAGSPSLKSTKAPNRRVGRMFASGFGGGWTGSNSMSIAQLKKKICPNGDCGSLFDGFSASDVVDVPTFLAMLGGEHGFGGWAFSSSHYNYIKNTSDAWGMKSPTINLAGGIPTNADYKVGDFENGTPQISFGSFQSMAESIFSAIPYKFYYDSSWKGSWLGALQAGACNCWDGAHAIIAFANACGIGGGSIVHGTWTDPDGTSYPHVWAVINGKKMDTTAWQQRGTWSAGSPTPRTATYNKPISNNNNAPVSVEITINGDIYGVDDLDKHIEDGIDKGLQKHFNKNYAVGY